VVKQRQPWQDLSAVVVGFGSIGRRHLRILQELGLKDLSVVDPQRACLDLARAEYAVQRTYSTFKDALESKPQTVFICSPTALHVEQARQAIQAQADVLTEKPLSTSVDGTEDLNKLAKSTGKLVMVAHCFRFHVGLRRVKKYVEEGRVGRLISIRSSVGEYIPDVMPNYQNMYISQYSGIYELMHDVDLALWYADQPPVRVMGVEGSFSDVGMNSPDVVEMIIEFKDRCLANVHLDFFQRARRRQVELLGTEGTLILEFANWNRCQFSHYDASTRNWSAEEIQTDRDDMFREENRVFLQAVISRDAVPVDVLEARRSIEIIDAIRQCQTNGKAVRLAPR